MCFYRASVTPFTVRHSGHYPQPPQPGLSNLPCLEPDGRAAVLYGAVTTVLLGDWQETQRGDVGVMGEVPLFRKTVLQTCTQL